MNERDYYVYILSNVTNVAIYVGVTNDLKRRVSEHKSHFYIDSFTAKNKISKLVYYEQTGSINAAIEREKQIKGWNRARKNRLIESKNPRWDDLFDSIME